MARDTIGFGGELHHLTGHLLAVSEELRDPKFISYYFDDELLGYTFNDGDDTYCGPTQSFINAYLFKNIQSSASDISSSIGQANGIAPLDANGQISSSYLPSYVDDVIEGYYDSTTNKFYSDELKTSEISGETGKIYVDITDGVNTNNTYRWTENASFISIASSLGLGTTHNTAFYGDYGQAAYKHGVTNKGKAFTEGFYKITTNDEGHVTNATSVVKDDLANLIGSAKDGEPGLVSIPTDNGISVDDEGNITLSTSYIINKITSSDTAYASTTSYGIIRVGSGLSIDSGVLSVDGQSVTGEYYTKQEINNMSYVSSSKLSDILSSYVKKSDLITSNTEFKSSNSICLYNTTDSTTVTIKSFGCYLWSPTVSIGGLDITNISIGGIAQADANGTSQTKVDFSADETSSKITQTVNYETNGVKYTKTITMTPYNKIYWGNVDKATTSFTDLSYVTSLSNSNSKAVNSPSSLGTISLATELNKYLWICIPSGMSKTSITVTNVTKEPNTSIIMRKSYDTVGTLNGENYYCFRVNDYWTDASTIKFKIS